jgi:hypothetical protein
MSLVIQLRKVQPRRRRFGWYIEEMRFEYVFY